MLGVKSTSSEWLESKACEDMSFIAKFAADLS